MPPSIRAAAAAATSPGHGQAHHQRGLQGERHGLDEAPRPGLRFGKAGECRIQAVEEAIEDRVLAPRPLAPRPPGLQGALFACKGAQNVEGVTLPEPSQMALTGASR